MKISRRAYAEMLGPTVGDKLRLADTALIIEIEQDLTLRAGGYGEEVKFGGGKTIRDGMAQSQRTREQGALDTVLTNALIIDHGGIIKADIGLKDHRIVGIGKAKETFYYAVLFLCVSAASFFACTRWFGVAGAAAAYVGSFLFITVVLFVYIQRFFPLSLTIPTYNKNFSLAIVLAILLD